MQIDNVSKVFLHVQNSHGQYIFFQTFFFVIKCAPFPLKIGEDINIDGRKKHLKLVKFILKHI
jgi:hypothetical protein